MTKNVDFVHILDRLGPPPQVIWITCGNTSNARLRAVLTATLPEAFRLLEEGEPLLEIKDAWPDSGRAALPRGGRTHRKVGNRGMGKREREGRVLDLALARPALRCRPAHATVR